MRTGFGLHVPACPDGAPLVGVAPAPRVANGVLAALLVTLLAGVTAPATAQSRVRAEVDTTLVTVGDRVTLTVSVEHPSGATVLWPDSISLEPFEAIDAVVEPTRTTGEVAVSTARVTLTAFELGELEIPPLEVTVLMPDGAREELTSDRFVVEIVSVGADEGGDIREIRGPLAIPVSALRLVLYFLLLLVPVLLAWLLYRRWRPGAPEEQVARGLPPRPAHEIALEELAALERSPLLQRGQVKEFHIAASDILRIYVERRFMVDAREMTTREILDGLERAGVGDTVREPLGRFLEQCDLVKFAKARPETTVSTETLGLGRDVVRDTIPEVPIADVPSAEPESPEPTDADVPPSSTDAVDPALELR